jgi:succinate dehydrogenase/fumarate reductase flavoprotein subunit
MDIVRKIDRVVIGFGLAAMLATTGAAQYYVHETEHYIKNGAVLEAADSERKVNNAIYGLLIASGLTTGATYRARRRDTHIL